MKLADFDWDYLCKDTLWPTVSALVATVILLASSLFHDRQKELHATYSVDQVSIHADYDQLLYRRRLVDRYHRRYDQFQSLGFVGRESRVDWVETIRIAATGMYLPHVTYDIEPQLEVITPVDSVQGGTGIQTYLSKLEMTLGLVHEVDLLRFFQRLETEAPGLMKIDRCSLSRQSGADQALIAGTNIVANCSLMMLSVITSDIDPQVAEL